MTVGTSNHQARKSNSNSRGKYLFLLQGLIIYLASLLLTGYQIYSANHEVQIPYVLWNVNPNLYPGDPLVSTFNHYIGSVWQAIAAISAFIHLETLLLVLFLVSRALILFSAAYLANSIAPGSKLAALGAMAFFALSPSPLVGHGTLVLNYFEHTGVSIAFLLLAVAAFYSLRPYQWVLWFVLGFYFNILYGFFACLYFSAVFLLDRNYRIQWRKWLPSIGLFLLVTIPVVLPDLLTFHNEVFDIEIWMAASEVRSPQHLFPHTWEKQQFVVYFGFLVSYLLVLFLSRKEMSRLYLMGMIFSGVSVIWLILAFLAAYVIRSPALLAIHPARGTDLWFAFSTVSMIAVLAYRFEFITTRKRVKIFFFFISILWLIFFYFPVFILTLLLIILSGLILPLLWKVIFKNGDLLRLANLVVLAILFISLSEFLFDNKQINDLIQYPDPHIMDLGVWARSNTNFDDMFLIEPNWEGFRAISQRPVFVSWKGGTAILWKGSFVEEWATRLKALGLNIDEAKEPGANVDPSQLPYLYKELDDDDVRQLARTYPIKYWIVRVEKETSFPVAYQTGKYKILVLYSTVDNR